jgi:uncharacterized protein (DUF1697 family)
MPTYAACLRAVNLGGATQLSMAALRQGLTGTGFRDVRTLLQSGNVVLRSEITDSAEVERRLEEWIARSGGRRTDVFVRTALEWRSLIDGNPFPTEARLDPRRLHVLLLKSAPPARAWDALSEAISGREVVRGAGRHGYAMYPDGVGHSRLTLDRIERTLGSAGTLRNWNTALKIEALLPE